MTKILLASLLVVTVCIAEESYADHEAKMQQMQERTQKQDGTGEQNRERKQNKNGSG
ncbi:MAG: hypothetical protein QG617_905, partial [Campylobacterota bacterium]|nr:hypothetical protein [Campylobacterota bacterium]